MDLVTEISRYTWLAYVATALYLRASGRGNLALVLALLCLSVPGAFQSLVQWEYLELDNLRELSPALNVIRLVGIALLVIGLVSLARRGDAAASPSAALQSAQAVNLATLFIPRNETNSYSRAESLRDEACRRLVARANKAGFGIVEQRSQTYSPNVWFRIDYLMPAPAKDLSLSASVAVVVERFDFHRYEHTFTVTVQAGEQITKIGDLLALGDDEADRIHAHIATAGNRLRLANRLRQHALQLWRPINRVERIRSDWMAPVAVVVPILVMGASPPLGAVLLLAVFVALYVRGQRRRTYILTSGKPFSEPRSLRWMDSWQASVEGLGAQEGAVRDGILQRLRSGGPEGASAGVESIGYWGTDSWVERDQIVVRHRRAIGFIHVVAYGSVLYVAWDSHLNSAAWAEQRLAAGIDRKSGLSVVANRVVAGTHQLNEYDLNDANFLAEWLHGSVKSEVKLRMAEQRIDQEIDFTVQRESRKGALGGAAPTATEEKRTTDRFRRVA